MKGWRFFYHYRKGTGRLSVHFRGKCLDVGNVWCRVGCESKWNARQPKLVMQGHAATVRIVNDTAVIG